MPTGGVHRVSRAGAHNQAASVAAARGHLQAVPQQPRSALPPLPTAPGPGTDWPVDVFRAQHDARMVLQSIDWSKPDIVIWVPGTSNHTVHPEFEKAVRSAWNDGGASLVKLEYEASWRMRASVATGIETLRIVLAEIKRRGGSQRVMLAGESQGAWIIGEALSDPAVSGVVTRAVLMGHPSVASHHFDANADSRIREINNPGDHVAMKVKGSRDDAFAAMTAIYTKDITKLPNVISALALNPEHGLRLALVAVRALLPKGVLKDPHDYTAHFSSVAVFLRGARADQSAPSAAAA